MRELIAIIQQELAEGRRLCLATIVGQQGSAPRSVGTSFLVLEDGAIRGTIGGGQLEAQVIANAGRVLAQGRAELLDYQMTGQDAAQSEMICGGRVQVYLDPQSPPALEFWALAAQTMAEAEVLGQGTLLATSLAAGGPPAPGMGRLLWRQGQLLWPVADEQRQAHGQLISHVATSAPKERPGLWSPPSGGEIFFLEPINNQPVVYILGAGHISLCLAPLVKSVGFGLVVVDDRPEYAQQSRFPMADQVLVRDFARVFEGMSLGPKSYLVIVTRGHLHDKEVLAQSLGLSVAYVGMIGSRRKRQLIYQAMRDEGCDPQRLAWVHSPIGLDIGAETPEEIAISIAAELIKVRADLSGQRKARPVGL